MHDFLRVFYVEQMQRCRAMTKPMIAKVHGFAQEGGCTMAYGCDMILASEGAPRIGASEPSYPNHEQRNLACKQFSAGHSAIRRASAWRKYRRRLSGLVRCVWP